MNYKEFDTEYTKIVSDLHTARRFGNADYTAVLEAKRDEMEAHYAAEEWTRYYMTASSQTGKIHAHEFCGGIRQGDSAILLPQLSGVAPAQVRAELPNRACKRCVK